MVDEEDKIQLLQLLAELYAELDETLNKIQEIIDKLSK